MKGERSSIILDAELRVFISTESIVADAILENNKLIMQDKLMNE
jgi:hypothetical protein